MRYGAYVLVSLIESKQFSDVRAICRLSEVHLDIVVKTAEKGEDAVCLANLTLLCLSRMLGLKDPVLRHKTRSNVLAYRVEEGSGRTSQHVL